VDLARAEAAPIPEEAPVTMATRAGKAAKDMRASIASRPACSQKWPHEWGRFLDELVHELPGTFLHER
jgi:hypothetical protein